MKVIQEFSMWCRCEVSKLKPCEGEKVGELSSRCKESCTLFTVEFYLVKLEL